MASSSAPQTRALVSTSVALTAETASPHTGGCGVTTARSIKPKFFMARAAAPMLFGSRGRTSTILLLLIFLRGRSCRCGDALRRMKINHEETKSTKKDQKNLRALRFFVVDFQPTS